MPVNRTPLCAAWGPTFLVLWPLQFFFFFYTDTTEENRTYFSLFLSSGESFQLNTCYEVNALSFSLGFEKATGISHGGKATQCQQIKIETWSFFFLGIFFFFSFFLIS